MILWFIYRNVILIYLKMKEYQPLPLLQVKTMRQNTKKWIKYSAFQREQKGNTKTKHNKEVKY